MKIDEVNTFHEGKCHMIYTEQPFSPTDAMIALRVNLRLPDGVNDSFVVYLKEGLDVNNAAVFAMGEEEDLPKYHISPDNYYRLEMRSQILETNFFYTLSANSSVVLGKRRKYL